MSRQTPFVYRRPRWGRGMITEEDARFLHDLVLAVGPAVAIELGVASGCSSVTILEAMRATGLVNPGVWLHAFDISSRCYFDASRPTGDAVRELTPLNLSRYRFTVGDVLEARRCLAGIGADFAFIDANHLHPWPTADLIGLLPALAPGAWVALHDVRLPFVTGRTDPRGHGPRHLFETWTGETRQGGTEHNVGAIRLPEDLTAVPAMLQPALRRPWEVALPQRLCTAFEIAARPVGVIPRPDALRVLARAAARERPVYVCGTGQAGRALAGELRRRRIAVRGFADRDAASCSTMLDGLPVQTRSALSPSAEPRPFLVLSGTFSADIDAELASSGWRRGKDYVVIW